MPDTSPVVAPIEFEKGYTDINVGQPVTITPPSTTVGKEQVAPLNPLEAAQSQAYYEMGQEQWIKNVNIDTPYKSQLSPTLRYDDPNLGYTAFDPNLEQKYGDEHPIKSSVNNLIKLGANAVGTFANGLLTIPTVLTSIASGNIANAYDNELTKGINDWMTNLEQVLPSYETSYKKEHPFLSYINPFQLGTFAYNWTNVAKNLGFTVGAIGSAVVEDLAIGGLTEGIGLPAALAANYSQLNKLTKYLIGGEEASQAYNIARKGGQSVLEAINQAAATNRIASKARYGLGLFTSAYGEGVFEAANIYTQTKQDLLNQYRQDNFGNEPDYIAMQQIEGAAKNASNAGLLFNTALLMATNSITLGNILKPTEQVSKQISAEVAKGLELQSKNINEFTVAATTPNKGLLPILKSVATNHLVTTGASEGFEEGAQYVISQGTEDYYTRRLKNDNIDEADSFWKAISKGVHDTIFTTQGMENIVMGALGGVLIHGFNKVSNAVRGITDNKMAVAQNIQSMLNNTTTTSLFNTQYDELVTATSLAKDYDAAIRNNDIYQAKNLRFQQLFNFVDTGIRANKYELRLGQLDMLKSLTNDSFKNLFGIEYNAQNKQRISDFVDNVIHEANRIKGHIDKVNEAFSNPFNPVRDDAQHKAFEYYKMQLALSAATIENNKLRVASVGDEVKNAVPTIDPNKIMALTSEKGIKSLISSFKERVKDLTDSENLSKTNHVLADGYRKDREFLEEKINNLEETLKNPDEYDYVKEVNELHNYFANAESTNDNGVFVDQMQSVDLYNKSHDMSKLTQATLDGIKYYNKLLGKKGFDTFSVDVVKNLQDTADTVHIDENGNIQIGQKQQEEVIPEPNVVVAAHDANVTPEQKQQFEDIAKKESEGKTLTDEELKLKADNADAIEKEKEAYQINKKRKTSSAAPITATNTTAPAHVLNPSLEDIHVVGDNIDDEPIGQFEKNVTPKERSLSQVFSGFNPVEHLNEMYSPSDRDSKGVKVREYSFKEALRKILFRRKPERVRESLSVRVELSSKGKTKNDYTQLPHAPNIYRSGYAVDATVYHGDTPIGVMTQPESLAFKRGENFVSLYEMTKEEYPTVTGNSANTYDLFMDNINSYRDVYNTVTKGYKEGQVKEVSNKDLRKIANIEIAYGSAEYTNNATVAPLLSKLNVRQKGDVVLSLPSVYNAQTGRMEKGDRPVILNAKDLTAEQLQETLDFISNNINQIKNVNKRYVYLNRMPDGTFSKVGILAARPVSEDSNYVGELFDRLKKVSQAPTPEEVAGFNTKFADEIYIADSRTKRTGKADFTLKVEQNGDVSLSVHAQDRNNADVNKTITVPKERVAELNSAQALAEDFNSRMSQGDLGRIGMKLSTQDFKRSILNDGESTMAELENKLTVAVKSPDVYRGFNIRFTKKTEEATAAPAPKVNKKFSKTDVKDGTTVQAIYGGRVATISIGKIAGENVNINYTYTDGTGGGGGSMSVDQLVDAVNMVDRLPVTQTSLDAIERGSYWSNDRQKAEQLLATLPQGQYEIADKQIAVKRDGKETFFTGWTIRKSNPTSIITNAPNRMSTSVPKIGTGEIKAVEVKDYTETNKNQYTPDQQLKFNQGVHFEAVTIVADPDFIRLIQAGSERNKNMTAKNPSPIKIGNGEMEALETRFGISAFDAYATTKELAKEHRDKNVPRIIVLGTENKQNETPVNTPVQTTTTNSEVVKPDNNTQPTPTPSSEPTVATATEQQELERRVNNLRMAMIDRKDLGKILQNGEWGMLTGENPNAEKATPEDNIKYNKKAEKWLKDKGYLVIPIVGRYGNLENSFYIPNLSFKDAVAFAKEFNQESVATDKGLVYQDGSFNPRIYDETKVGVDYNDANNDFFSVINAFGTPIGFSIGYDFNTKTTLEEQQRQKEEASRKAVMTEEEMRSSPVDTSNENEEEQAKHRFAIYWAWSHRMYDDMLRNGTITLDAVRDILKSTGKGEEYVDDIQLRLNNTDLNYQVSDILTMDRKSILFQHVRNYMIQTGAFETAIKSGIISPADANAIMNTAGIRSVTNEFNYDKVVKPLEDLIKEKIEQAKTAKKEATEDVKTVVKEREKRTRKPTATKVEQKEITTNGLTPEELEAEATRLIAEADNTESATPVMEESAAPIATPPVVEESSVEDITPQPQEAYQSINEAPQEEDNTVEQGDDVTYEGMTWNVLSKSELSGRLHIQTSDPKAGRENERIINESQVKKINKVDPHANDSFIRILQRMEQRFPNVKWKLVSSNENWKGRFRNGVVEINTKKATNDTPIHEYLHPFVFLLRRDNEVLYRNLVEELQKYGESYLLEVANDANYKGLTPEEKLDEALVRYIANAMSQNFDAQGRRYDTENYEEDAQGKVIHPDKQSAWYDRATKAIQGFYTWLKDMVLKLIDRRDVRNNELIEHDGFDISNPEDLALLTQLKGIAGLIVNKQKLTDEQKELRATHKDVIKKEIDALRQKISERKETSFIKANDRDFSIPVNVSDFDFNFTLEDLADFLSFNDNIQLDFGKDTATINTLESYQYATGDEAKKLLDRVKRKAEQLEQTSNKRFPSKSLQDELIAVRTLIKNFDEATFVQEYIRMGVTSLTIAKRIVNNIASEVRQDNLKNLKPEDVQRLQRDVMEARTMYGMYEDVQKMLNYNVDDFERDEWDDMRRDLDASIATKDKIGDVVGKLTTEWLFPEFDELQQKVIANNPDKGNLLLTKEEFAQKLRYIERDASFMTYWLGSAITSRDPIAQVIAVKVKDILNKNYEDETQLGTDVRLSYRKFLADKGLPNNTQKVTDFYKKNYLRTIQVYEPIGRDANGNTQYGYVDRLAFHTEFDWHRWDDDLRKEAANYPTPLNERMAKDNDAKRIAWIQANTQTINGNQMPSEKYRNQAYKALSNDAHFKFLYDTYAQANEKYKDQSLSYGIIPQTYKPETIIQKVKDRAKRLKEYGKNLTSDKSKNAVEKASQAVKDAGSHMLGGDAYEKVEDLNLDETYYKNIKSPYTHLIKDQNDIDVNLPETVLGFYKAANYFSSLKEIQPNIENFKLMLTGNAKFGIEARKAMKVSRDLGKVWDRFAGKPQTVEAERLNKQLLAQLNDVFYGDTEYNMDVNLAGVKMNMNTVAKNIGFYTAARNLAGNLFAGISNVTIGNAQTLGEAIGGRYYNIGDWASAEKEYWLNVPKFLADGTLPIKSKITQLGVRYDAIQGEFRDKHGKIITGSILRKINTSSLFLLSHAGEHQIQLTGMIALMKATKVQLQGGGEVSLFDAYQATNDGIYRLRNDAVWGNKNDLEFTRKLHSISRDLNGSYADYDKAMLQRYWIGRLVLQYRKYMYPAFRSRFARERIDLERGDVEKGYYRTFMRKLINEAKEHQWRVWKIAYDTFINKKQMTAQEKYAINKFTFDMVTIGAMTALAGLLVGGSGDDNKKKQWLVNSAGLLSLRLRSDIATYSLFSAQDFSKQLQNPAASVQSVTNVLDFMGQFVGDAGHVLTGGDLDRYKSKSSGHEAGDTKLGAKFKKIVPVWRQYDRAMNPQDQIQYYQLTNQDVDTHH